jgi:hypothetical protein
MHSQLLGSRWLRDLYEQFTVVRQEAEQYGEDEINASIDVAVAAVRFLAILERDVADI